MPHQRPHLVPLALMVLAAATPSEAFRYFNEWFPNSVELFADVSKNTCNASLRAFETLWDSYSDKTWIDLGLHEGADIYRLCRAHENCILENVSEVVKASMGTSGVVLGLLPTLLAVLSPSITEVALIAVQRPLLASLISLGSPGTLQTRVFEYTDPGELLDLPDDIHPSRLVRVPLVLGPWPMGAWSSMVAVGEYILVLASILNVLSLCIQISHRAILTWGCTRTWPVILWALIPLFINLIGSLGYRLTLDRKRLRSMHGGAIPDSQPIERTYSLFTRLDSKTDATQTTTAMTSPPTPPPKDPMDPRPPSSPSLFQRISHWLVRELSPSAVHPPTLRTHLPVTLPHPSPRLTVGIVLQCIAGFLSCFHLLYGTVTFSGLLFIDALDAIGQIAMRLLASALVCRFVGLVEVAGMRGAIFAAKSR